MPIDGESVRHGCPGARVTTARELCGAELSKFRTAVSAGVRLVVGCTQEQPLFSEIAGSHDRGAGVRYVNVRENAGWSNEAANAGAKMAALIAAAAEGMPEIPSIALDSSGVVLIYGRDEQAIEAANLLKDHLDVTVLIAPPASVIPPRVTAFPVVQGRIRSANGHLGAFELTIDD